MSTTIESLELEVQSNSTSAVSGIDALSTSLSKLKNATKGGMGLTSVANQVRSLNTALQTMDSSSADKIDKLSNSLSKLSSLGKISISSSIGNQLKNIGSAASALNGADFSGLTSLSTALQPLSEIGKATGLQSTITQLKKLPELATTLSGIDWSTFTSQLQQLSDALAPLATQLNSVSTAFSKLPSNISKTVTATNKLPTANNKAATSYVNFYAKIKLATNAVKQIASVIASWITESNSYIESLNLFTASMGEYAEEAQAYAEQVAELMGIDPADWMRNQGVFNTIIEGFGVASDQAYLMSKNLTQLGYDISSFFNISVEDAMQKLESGISGELEPLRRLGYDLSVARLQQEALNLGIEKSVSKMTQAEKSQLRYYAIMTQVTTAQGDMARTLNAPANQLRVLQAQVTQCARALGNIFIPALNAVLPYAIALAKVLRLVAEEIANFFGFTLPEVDYSSLTSSSSAVSDLADDADSAASGLSDASDEAKKLKKNLLGIDELNVLSNDTSSDSSSGSGSGSDLGIDLPSYDFLGDLVSTRVDEIVDLIKGALEEITAVISGFLLAIGTILVVTGANIPLGLGLMAIGAVGLASVIVENWNYMSERLAKTLTLVTAVLGGFLLAIGAFLAFSGVNVPLGAALMVAGAVSLATAATINWKFLNGDLSNALSILTAVVSGALLAMGALFAFTGVDVPLGIALMAAGAIGLVTAAGLNWDFMSDPVKKAVGTLEAIVGGALLTFGAILALSGTNVPLGVAMIAAGAIAIVSAVALNWNALTGDLQGSIATITAIVSGALIGIGAVLALSGVATAVGIAMIAAGAVGLVATASLNWGSITGEITKVLQEIGIAVGAALLAVGAILALSGVALPLGIALMAAGAVSLVTGIALNWNSVVSSVKGALQKVGVAAGAALLALGVILCLSGVGIPLGIALIAAGAGSLASGVALNWDTIVEKVTEGLGKIKDTVTTWAENIKEWWNDKVDKLVSFAAEVKNDASEWWSNVKKWWKKKVDAVDEFTTNVKNGASEWWGNVKDWWGDKVDAVEEFVTNVKNDASTWWQNTKSWWSKKVSSVTEFTTNVKNQASTWWQNTKSWWGEKVSSVSEFTTNVKNTASTWWQNAKTWWSEQSSQGLSVDAGVELVKKGWTTIKGWIGSIPVLSQAISLIKSGWTTVKAWIGNIPTLSQAISLIKSGWTTVKNWIGTIPTLSQAISLIKSGWTTVKNWIGNIPTLSQAISLIKSGWTTVKNWIGNIPTLSQAINLIKSGWTTVKNWIGTIPVLSQGISLLKSGWTTVKSWIGTIPVLSQGISLIKSGWTSISSWIGSHVVSVGISLFKSGWSSISSFVGNSVSVGVSLFKDGWSSIKSFFGLSSGGYDTGHGFAMFSQGGYINGKKSSFWKNIPMYANGTASAGSHGSLFVAGESGAEIVGHINGQTEVLNQSQIAQAMKSAVIAGMSLFEGYWRTMNSLQVTCANAIINSIMVCTDSLIASANEVNKYDPTNTLADSVYADSQRYNDNFSEDSMKRAMQSFYQEYVEPTLKEIAADTKRQADKEEQTIVKIGNRSITDAVVTQQKANGYSFT